MSTIEEVEERTGVHEREDSALGIVKRNALWAAGVGLIAVPFVDIAGVTVVQLKMLKELADNYETPFSEELGKSAVASLLAGLGHRQLAFGALASTLKAIPGLGTIIGAVSVPLFGGAVTYATGRVFVQHFESGGTFLSFDPAKVRDKFKQAFEEGKPVVAKSMEEQT